MIIGYTTGVFDIFHNGHLNILKNAKLLCDKLIVGVTTDEYVHEYKGIKPTFNFSERCEILSSIKYVDVVVPQRNHNKFEAWERYKFDIIVVGDDWMSTKKWNEFEKQFDKVGVKIIYLERTPNISSTVLRKKK